MDIENPRNFLKTTRKGRLVAHAPAWVQCIGVVGSFAGTSMPEKLMSHAFLLSNSLPGDRQAKNRSMPTDSSLSFLQQPFGELGFSAAFIEKAAAMKLDTPEDVILSKETAIREHPAYSDAWYDELIDFLDERGALYLLDSDFRTEK